MSTKGVSLSQNGCRVKCVNEMKVMERLYDGRKGWIKRMKKLKEEEKEAEEFFRKYKNYSHLLKYMGQCRKLPLDQPLPAVAMPMVVDEEGPQGGGGGQKPPRVMPHHPANPNQNKQGVNENRNGCSSLCVTSFKDLLAKLSLAKECQKKCMHIEMKGKNILKFYRKFSIFEVAVENYHSLRNFSQIHKGMEPSQAGPRSLLPSAEEMEEEEVGIIFGGMEVAEEELPGSDLRAQVEEIQQPQPVVSEGQLVPGRILRSGKIVSK